VPGTIYNGAPLIAAGRLLILQYPTSLIVSGLGPANPRITSVALPIGHQSVAYSGALAADRGAAPYSWQIVGGTLPTGTSLAADGTLSGTPTAAGTGSVTVRATDAFGVPATVPLSWEIAPSSAASDWATDAADAGRSAFNGAETALTADSMSTVGKRWGGALGTTGEPFGDVTVSGGFAVATITPSAGQVRDQRWCDACGGVDVHERPRRWQPGVPRQRADDLR